MCSWGYILQVRGATLTKNASLLGREERFRPSTCLLGRVLTLFLLPKRVFKCQSLYVWKSLCEVGLSQFLCIDWLLAWNVVSPEAGLSSLTHLWSRHLGMRFRGRLFFVQSNLWLPGLHCSPQITWFTMVGYRPLPLSDKHSLNAPFVNSSLDAWVWACLSSCIDKSIKAIGYTFTPCSITTGPAKRFFPIFLTSSL